MYTKLIRRNKIFYHRKMIAPKDTPVMAQYREIKSQYPDCLLFFRLGDFYELFGEDARVASQELSLVLTARHKNSAQEIPMCGVPFHASHGYIAKLVKKGFKVAVCEQLEDAATKESKGPIKRDVVRVVTAGTLMEEDLLEAKENNYLIAVVRHLDTCSLACVDISTGEFLVETHDIRSLEEALSTLNPKEILLPESVWRAVDLESVWASWKKNVTLLPDPRFDPANCQERLQQFFGVQTTQGLGTFSESEICASGALVDYVLITQKRSSLKLNRPKRLVKDHLLRLDAFTRRNLELFENLTGEKDFSLLHTLDQTMTPFGARLLAFRLAHPISHLETLTQRLDSVDFFMKRETCRQTVQLLLKKMPDIERLTSRLVARRGTPKDLLNLRQGLQLLPHLKDTLEDFPEELTALAPHLCRYDPYKKVLEKALLDLITDDQFIAPGYDAKLDTLRDLQKNSQHIVEDLQKRYVQETQVANLKIRYNKIIGHYIEVSPSAASKMPFHFMLKQTLVTSLRYTTTELTELAQRLESATQEACEMESVLFETLINQLGHIQEPLRELCQLLAVLDVSTALAGLASQYHYVRPLLDDSRMFDVKGGRHPIVEKVFLSQHKDHFVKNNCFLNADKTLWLMTGPNMAGKSTFLRQNALITLMAHIGSFVPADFAHIGLVDRLFTRVGANDNLARGQSTFMVEMVETASILNQATDKSFVILDEVGRGTSTQDGLALAWSCAEYMLDKICCRTLFATHYHELTVLKNHPAIDLYTFKITEWNEQIVFFHEVIPGFADRSYGIHVARLAGLPSCLLERASYLLAFLSDLHQTMDYKDALHKRTVSWQAPSGNDQERASISIDHGSTHSTRSLCVEKEVVL